MRKPRPNARLVGAHDVCVVWRHGKVTITLAPAASFQRAGDVGQLRRDPLRRVSRQLPLTGKIVKPAARAVIEACGLFAAA